MGLEPMMVVLHAPVQAKRAPRVALGVNRTVSGDAAPSSRLLTSDLIGNFAALPLGQTWDIPPVLFS
jgi:hypothetical protein